MGDHDEERANVTEHVEELWRALRRDDERGAREYWTSDHVNTLSVWAFPGRTTKVASVQIRRDVRGGKRVGDVIFAKKWKDDPAFNVLDEAYDQGVLLAKLREKRMGRERQRGEWS